MGDQSTENKPAEDSWGAPPAANNSGGDSWGAPPAADGANNSGGDSWGAPAADGANNNGGGGDAWGGGSWDNAPAPDNSGDYNQNNGGDDGQNNYPSGGGGRPHRPRGDWTGAEPSTDEPSAPGPASKLLQSSYEVKVTLRDQQADPNSPLYSAKSFEDLGLHPFLLKGIYSMKFQKPSKIQEKAMPLLLANPPTNMIAQSQSGTGKTAAFSLTMLSRIAYGQEVPQCICLAPSRELARQIEIVVQTMGKFLPLKTFLAVRDGWNRQTQVNAHVVVGTPGTVMDMIGKRVLDVRGVKVLVLDEADDMLDIQGLGDHTMRIKKMIPPNAQTLLFSATFPERVDNFAADFAPNANSIRLRTEELSVEGIKQFYMDCANEDVKYDVLLEIYNLLTIGQSIIFCAVSVDSRL